MSIENVLKHIIDHHNQVEGQGHNVSMIRKDSGEGHHHYWHQKLEEVDSKASLAMVERVEHNLHHIGDLYRQGGMKINLKKKSTEAENLIKVMNFIIHGMTQGDMAEGSILESYLEDGEHHKVRSLDEVDSLAEYEIKAIAVSILAETNGNVGMAKDILTISGFSILKKMNANELQHLKSDLQSISACEDDNKEGGVGGYGR